jgi:uncharacterized membrane protein (UPF0127 family)
VTRRVLLALCVVFGLWSCGPATSPGVEGPSPAPDVDVADPDGAGSDTSDTELSEAPYPDADDPAAELPTLGPELDGLPTTTVTVETSDDRVEVAAWIAADDPSRRRGLMEVEELPDGVGMLFLFAAERTSGFWMWNTRIPLDIGFVAADGTMHTIATMVPCEASEPADCPITAPELPYVAALEVPAGWFARAGVEAGATLTWTEPRTPLD